MAYDQILAERVQSFLADQPGLVSKKMFGGTGYMLHGNMACGVHKESLIVRVGPEGYDAALAEPHTRPFDITGRPMKGWVMVSAEGCQKENELKGWVTRGVNYALSLTPK